MVVDARRGDVDMAQQFVDLGDVCLVDDALVATVARSACAPIWKPSAADSPLTILPTPLGVIASAALSARPLRKRFQVRIDLKGLLSFRSVSGSGSEGAGGLRAQIARKARWIA